MLLQSRQTTRIHQTHLISVAPARFHLRRRADTLGTKEDSVKQQACLLRPLKTGITMEVSIPVQKAHTRMSDNLFALFRKPPALRLRVIIGLGITPVRRAWML
jgi:hypothetical protein